MLACNIGKTDKIVRIVIGVIIFAAGFVFNTWLGVIGLIPILTAVFGRCGLYYLLKINTAKSDNNS